MSKFKCICGTEFNGAGLEDRKYTVGIRCPSCRGTYIVPKYQLRDSDDTLLLLAAYVVCSDDYEALYTATSSSYESDGSSYDSYSSSNDSSSSNNYSNSSNNDGGSSSGGD